MSLKSESSKLKVTVQKLEKEKAYSEHNQSEWKMKYEGLAVESKEEKISQQ